MTKAKTIDRLELTRKKFTHLNPSNSKGLEHNHSDAGLNECPYCGAESLRSACG